MHAESTITFRYRHTHCGVLRGRDGRWLAIDAGWPCSLFEYARALKEAGARLEDIAWCVVTHMHPDHGGLVSDFLARGITCVALPGQRDAVAAMERIIQKDPQYAAYRAIECDALLPLAPKDSRAWLASVGIAGTIIATPGHSDDSVSLVTDAGDTWIGDLYVPELVPDDDTVSRDSWRRLWDAGARAIQPAHHPRFTLTDAQMMALGAR
jgi:endoribonuclease LACTB2